MKEPDTGLDSSTPVGVVGAGTMGRGIARIAAGAGHRVLLLDVDPEAAMAAMAEVRSRLERDVATGRLTVDEADAVHGRLSIVEDPAGLASTGLVVEAVAERLDVKHRVFADLERHAGPETILATNTSSLSVGEIATAVSGRHRVVGMHFFNPAPVLPLVEVVRASGTAPEVVTTVMETVRRWGKIPVECADTPGFIVNRIARPFYLEALRLLENGDAVPPQLDAAFRGAGFRMGPFELLDLIGLDINLAVSESVHAGLGSDPRITPSVLQRRMVAAGTLGKKSGRGFYHYPDGPPSPTICHPAPVATATIVGDIGHAAGLADRLETVLDVARVPGDEGPDRIVVNGHDIFPAPRPADDGAVLDVVVDWETATAVGAAGDPEALSALAGACSAAGVDVVPLADTPGLVVLRTVAMIVTIASEAAAAGVASPAAIDTAMRLGVNHPLGPFEWQNRLGRNVIDLTLRMLRATDDAERYQPRREALQTDSAGLADDPGVGHP